MEPEKRRLIIKEIEHWRKTKMLPAQYCDFLLNLYLEDGAEKPKTAAMGNSVVTVMNRYWKIGIGIMSIFSAISFILLYSTSFGIPLQIGVSAFFIVCCYVIGAIRSKQSPLFSLFLYGLAGLFLLILGIYFIKQGGVSNPLLYVAYVVFCSLVWLFTGFLERIGLFQYCGWIGIASSYAWLMHDLLTDLSWLALELSWIPISLLSGWMGYLFHHKNKQVGRVLFLVGITIWLMPEAFGLLFTTEASVVTLQLSLWGKLIGAGIVIFLLRKKWTEWVV